MARKRHFACLVAVYAAFALNFLVHSIEFQLVRICSCVAQAASKMTKNFRLPGFDFTRLIASLRRIGVIAKYRLTLAFVKTTSTQIRSSSM
jgi:hypothetical protein